MYVRPLLVCCMLVWLIGYLATRLVSLANCLNMASLADDVYYKLLDEVKYFAFDSLRVWKTRPNLAGDCRNLRWNTFSSLSYTVAAALCQNDKIWSSLNF